MPLFVRVIYRFQHIEEHTKQNQTRGIAAEKFVCQRA